MPTNTELPKVYVVICRDDVSGRHATPPYVAATRRLMNAEQAAYFAQGVSPSREPRIVSAIEYLRICLGWTDYSFDPKTGKSD